MQDGLHIIIGVVTQSDFITVIDPPGLGQK